MAFIYKKNVHFICICFTAFILLGNCSAPKRKTNASSIIALNHNWEYRLGDSPADSSGRLIWLDDSLGSAGWTSIEEMSEIPISGARSLWIRTRLPDEEIHSPAMHIGGPRQIIQVYLNSRQIFEFGDFTKNHGNHFMGWRQLLIGLPSDYQNGILCFRIWSGHSLIGLSPPFKLGPAGLIMNRLFLKNADEMIFATLCLFFGLTLIALYFYFQRNRLFLGLALFLTSVALFTGSNSLYLQTVINAPRAFFILDIFSLLTMPVGALILIQHLVIEKFKTALRCMWQLHLIYLIVSFFITFFMEYRFIDWTYHCFFAILSLNMIISLVLILLSLRKGGPEVRMFLVGMILFFIFAALEIIFYYVGRINQILAFKISWIHIGALCFVISLFRILFYQYTKTNRQKEAAQKKALESAIHSERLKSQIALKHLESEKFRELDQMKSRFFANISHEFRTPLTLILGTARQALDLASNKNIQSKMMMQMKSGKRLLDLVNELLDLSRVDAGEMQLRAIQSDILPLVRNVCHSFEHHAQHNQIEFAFQSDLHEAMLWFDPGKMEKVVFNLVANAIKFTPAGGQVDVLVLKDEFLKIRVTDTGQGISEEHLPHVFDRFYQASEGYAKERGSGIGLALACELVKLHHGEITVESEPGKGSVFTVRLPLGSEHLKKEDLTPTPQSHLPLIRGTEGTLEEHNRLKEKTYSQKRKESEDIPNNLPLLLIIEDNKDMRNHMCEILTDNYQRLEADNGQSGFDLAVERIPDLVISDVMMPVMDGYQLCEKLKTDERTSHIPVVLLTARSDHRSKIEGLTLGADDYLTKPFEPSELIVRVNNLIDQRRKLRERFSKEITAPLSEIAVMPADEHFLCRARKIVQSRLNDPDVDVEWFSREMGFSRSQMHRKMTAVTGKSPSEFITRIRLEHAVQMLENRTGSISEIAYQVGFNSPSYFRKCFKENYGVTPSEYQKDRHTS